MDRPRLVRTALRSTFVVVVLLALLQLAYWLGVRRYFVSLEEAVAPIARLTHERIVAFPPGRFGVDGLQFSVNTREERVLTAERLRLQGVESAWLMRWLTGIETSIPDRLTMDMEGVRLTPELLSAFRASNGGVGLMLPFEGFGCHEEPVLSDADYQSIGWVDMQLDLNLKLTRDRARSRLAVDMRIDRAPAGVLRLSATFVDVPDAGIPLRQDLGGARLQRLSLDYDEQGALAGRNKHCAGARADSNKGFVAEHLRQLHQWLGANGLVPDEPIWAAYASWLNEGGVVHLELAPAQAVTFAEYAQFAPPDRLRLLGIDARFGGGDPVRVEATTARHGQEEFRRLPSLEIIDQAQIPELRMLHAGIPDDITFSQEDVQESETTSIEPVEAIQPPQASTSAEAAQSLAPASSFKPIEFPELALHLGHWVRISTINGNRYRGLVLDATADAVELEIRRYGGGARLPISRDQINRIDLVQIAALDRG